MEGFKLKFEKFLNGCDSIEEIDQWDKEEYGEMDVFFTADLVSVIVKLIVSDGEVTQKEVDYLNKMFGYDYGIEEVMDIYEDCGDIIDAFFDDELESSIDMVRKVNEKLADAYADLLVTACDLVAESDGIVMGEEIELAKKVREAVVKSAYNI